METFVHIAEERTEVPYRFWKTFTGKYISSENENIVTVNFYARRFDDDPVPIVDVGKINSHLRKKDIITSKNLGSGRVSICNSVEMIDELTKTFSEDPLFPLI